MTHILINGKAFKDSDAQISVDERAVRFGDGLFETIAVHNGFPYLWEYHLTRLEEGLSALRIAYDTKHLRAEVMELLRLNHMAEGILRVSVSRGIGSRGYLPTRGGTPTTILQTMERPRTGPTPATLWLSTYEKISPKALPTQYKHAQGLNSTLARMEASDHDCNNALQLDAHGHIAEAASANIFWKKDRTLYTPALSTGALGGVTRKRLMELSPYKVEEGLYKVEELANADAVILTNASMGITPVTGLLPLGVQWDSAPLAEELAALRTLDIAQYSAHLRESLAQS